MQESCGLASLRPYREAFKLLLALLLGQVGFQVSRPSGGGEGEDSGSPVSQPLHRGPVWGVLSGCPWRSSSRVGGGGSFPVGAAGPIPNTGFTPRWCSAALSCGQLPRSALLAAEALPHPQAVSGLWGASLPQSPRGGCHPARSLPPTSHALSQASCLRWDQPLSPAPWGTLCVLICPDWSCTGPGWQSSCWRRDTGS